ncbi:MAG: LytTR family DNA-binding domain-containing protein [Pseudomonadota bacterium]
MSWAITMALGGLFLAIIGATDSYQYSLTLRLTFWLGLCAVAGVIAVTIERAFVGFGLRPQKTLIWWGLLATALAVAMVPIIFLVNSTGTYSPIADLPVFAVNSFAISAALSALRLLIGTLLTNAVSTAPAQTNTTVRPVDTRPPLLERLKPGLRSAELWALKSEGHYLKVITDQGSELILMRLKDAIAETSPIEGMQVHRSWWLARRQGIDRRINDGRIELTLDQDTWVPISRTYRAAWVKEDW